MIRANTCPYCGAAYGLAWGGCAAACHTGRAAAALVADAAAGDPGEGDERGRRVLVVGEAPSQAYGGRPLWGDAGRRFSAMAGVPWRDLVDVIEGVNLLDAWPGPAAGGGSALPPAVARGRPNSSTSPGRRNTRPPRCCGGLTRTRTLSRSGWRASTTPRWASSSRSSRRAVAPTRPGGARV